MQKELIFNSLRLVLTEEELTRVSIESLDDGLLCINVDVHHLNQFQAKRLVSNITNIPRESCYVNVIHGFNHGVTLKKKITSMKLSCKVTHRESPDWNPGQTYLKIVV